MAIELSFSQYGEGAPIILLHGNGESREIWSAQIAALATNRRVIAVDTRGHGASPRGTAPFTLKQFATDLLGFMDRLGLPQADLLGFSDGGNIALLFALQNPSRVRRLIICGANLRPAGMRFLALLAIDAVYALSWLAAPFSQSARQKRDLYGLMAKEPHIRPSSLQTLTMPALVLAGTHDLVRERHTRRIARALPHATLRLLSGGHMLPREQPEAFNAAVLAFLSETR